MRWAEGQEVEINKILSEESSWPAGQTVKKFFDELKDQFNEHDNRVYNFIKGLEYAEQCQKAVEAEAEELEAERASRASSPAARSPAGGVA